MYIDNITIEKINTVLHANKNVLFAYLFGSQAKKTATPLSDIDVAAYLACKPDGDTRLEILGSLIDILKTDHIDLVILNKAFLSLKIRVLKSNRLILDNAPFIRHAFESATMRISIDFARFENRILKQRFLNG
jgi:uncharacterized protein